MFMFQPFFHSTPVGRVWTPMTLLGMDNKLKLVPVSHFTTPTGPPANQATSTSVASYLLGAEHGTTLSAAILFQSYEYDVFQH